MPKKFDPSLKFLLQHDPGAWLALAGVVPDGPLSVVSAELSTVTTEADAAVLVDGPEPWLVHLEFQTGADRTLGSRLLRYNVLLGHREERPVESVLVLLRPAADDVSLTGLYRRTLPGGRVYHEFRYRVVRVWEFPLEAVLTGGLATLPLAPVAAGVTEADLPAIIQRMGRRLDREAEPGEAKDLWGATLVLMGLRYPKQLSAELLKGVRNMRESSTYQMILEEGRVEGRVEGRDEGRTEGLTLGQIQHARRTILRLGRKRFGEPTAEAASAVESATDVLRLDAVLDRIDELAGWGEVVQTLGQP